MHSPIHLLDKNNSFTRALSCLSHPSSLLCILVLIYNDLVIKYQWPGWISGKLSDFAGLYFFPFLIGLVISFVFIRRDIQAVNIGRFSIAFTAIWFMLIKVSLPVNQLTSNLVETMLGSPSVIVLDPTDLIAVPVLIPAWYLWQSRKPTHPQWRTFPVVILAALATMGTSCPDVGRVTNLFLFENRLYIYEETRPHIVVSVDAGQSWADADEPPGAVLEDLERQRTFPIVACFADNQAICYRVNGEETIERSADGGSSYQVVWETPPGRRYFLDRKRAPTFAPCGRSPDLGPYDLSLLGSSVAPIVVAAAGNEGVIVGSEQAGWERLPVQPTATRPTPYFETDPDEVLLISLPEVFILTFSGFTAALIISWTHLNLAVQLSFDSNTRITAGKKIRLPAKLGTFSLLVALLLAYLAFGGWFSLSLNSVPVILFLFFGLLIVGFARSWYLLSKSLHETRKLGLIPYLGLAGGLVIFPLAWTPFILWITGSIPWYQVAQGLAAILFLIAIYLGIWGRQKIKSGLQIEGS